MRRADRLFEIIQYLRTRRVTTAAWLSERLEVSERTIYRDIQDLVCTGVPIDGEAGVGYMLRRGFDLPPLMFTEDEITALVLGARLVQSRADSKLGHAADQLLRKVESVLPDNLKTRLDNIHLYSPLVMINSKVADVLGVLRTSIRQQNKIEFDYIRADGTASHRIVWPLGLFYWGDVWTLGAWCELRQELRNFRPDRLDNLQELKQTFEPTAGRSINDIIDCGRSDMGAR